MQNTKSSQKKVLERDLLRPVVNHLAKEGCEAVVSELPFFDRGIDVYGIKSGKAPVSIAVELKLRDWQKALRQAAIYQLCSDFCYVALPQEKAVRVDLFAFRQCGIGLLGVSNSRKIEVILQARKSIEQRPYYVRMFRQAVLKGKHGRK